MNFSSGTMIISRGNYEITKNKEIEEYYALLLPLYKKFGYKPGFRGLKSADVHGFSIQMYIGWGFFPSVNEAIDCHNEKDYKEAVKIRDSFMHDYRLTIYSNPGIDVFSKLSDAYQKAGNDYIEDSSFIVYANNIDVKKIEKAQMYSSEILKVMEKYGFEPYYFGKKVKTIEGKDIKQEYIGVGFYPDVKKALNCFIDSEYHRISDEREEYLFDFETTIFGPVK
jgi:uncharacterized protein (DUF1330 family)